MYNMGDDSYLKQPKLMNRMVTDALIEKVYSHCLANGIKEFLFAFHGGEPLLASMDYYRQFVSKAKLALGDQVKSYFAIQTNGTLLNTEWCDLFDELNIQVGISLDGEKNINDQYRVDHQGKGSYDRTIKGLENALNTDWNKKTLGILSVLNIHADPIESYEHFKRLRIPNIDFLLPYNNYDSLPPGMENSLEENTLYGDWLISVFDHWYKDKSPGKPSIRMFNGIIESLFGGEFPNDLLGNYNNQLLVIETDGSIEAVDYLKSCGNNFTKAGANILTHELSSAVDSKLAHLYINCHTKLHKQCLGCPVNEICGGGNLTSRYSSRNGFNNPSVYCKDLLKLITHIQQVVFGEIPLHLLKEHQVELIDYQEAREIIKSNLSQLQVEDYTLELENF